MSHLHSIRLARPVEVGQFTLRSHPVKKEQAPPPKTSTQQHNPPSITQSPTRSFRPYAQVLSIMKSKLSKEALLRSSPIMPKCKSRMSKPQQAGERNRSALSDTNLSPSIMARNPDQPELSNEAKDPTAKKFQLKLHSTEVTDFDLMSTLKLRHEQRRSRTYSQIHRQKSAFVRASQLCLTRYS